MKKLPEIYLIFNLALIMGVVLGDICYLTLGGTLLKGLTSGLFVLLGLLNLSYLYLQKTQNRKFPIVMVVGLIFAMLGDILLNIEFIVGAILFAIGHVFYFAAYCCLTKFRWLDLAYGAAIFVPAALFILLVPFFDFGSILMQVICLVYALIISAMVGKAIANLTQQHNARNILIVIGSILFFFSDLMLLLNVFGNLPKFVDVLCLATYYPAECLLAFTILAHHQSETADKLN